MHLEQWFATLALQEMLVVDPGHRRRAERELALAPLALGQAVESHFPFGLALAALCLCETLTAGQRNIKSQLRAGDGSRQQQAGKDENAFEHATSCGGVGVCSGTSFRLGVGVV